MFLQDAALPQPLRGMKLSPDPFYIARREWQF
jgi:hypothetical protein